MTNNVYVSQQLPRYFTMWQPDSYLGSGRVEMDLSLGVHHLSPLCLSQGAFWNNRLELRSGKANALHPDRLWRNRGVCYPALCLLFTCDLGERAALPPAHCTPTPLLGFKSGRSCDYFLKWAETASSIKTTLRVFSFPKRALGCWRSCLPTSGKRLLPPHSADQELHILSSTHQLWLPTHPHILILELFLL